MRFIGTQKISIMRIPVPSLHEQNDIANILYAFDKEIDALESEACLLDELFQAMLEELMAGRLSTAGLIEAEATS